MIIFFLIIQRDTPHHIHAQRQNHWRSWIGLLSRGVKENNAGNRSVCATHAPTHPHTLARQFPLREHERDQHQFSYRDHISLAVRATRAERDATAGVSKENPSKYLIKNIYTNFIGQIDRRERQRHLGERVSTLCVARTLFLIYHTHET